MPIDIENNEQQQQPVAADDSPSPVSVQPDTGNAAPQQSSAPTVTPAPSPQPQAQQQSQPQAPQSQPPATPANDAVVNNNAAHPAVKKASLLRDVAQALAGGPRYTTTIDPTTGATTRTAVPLSSRDIGMAIALEAISGALSGLAVTGPGATGRAAAAGFQQGQQQIQQAQAQREQQAQQDFQNQSNQLARRASVYETNSRAILNTAEAEQRGAEAIDKLTDINRQSGVLDVDSDLLDNGGTPMTQVELMDAMKSGKLSPTDQLGPVAGRVEMTNADGSKRWEATHLILKDPSTPTSLSQADWDRYADGGVPGFQKGTKIGNTVQVSLRMKQNANEILASHYLADQRLDDLRTSLDGTQYASHVPTRIDFSKPGVNAAMQRFQRYVSHDAANLQDPFSALQAMGQAKRDPKTGQVQPNPDAKYVDTVASAFGGWPLLEAAHDQLAANRKSAADFAVIDSEAKANAVLAAPKRFTQEQQSAAHNFLQLSDSQGAKKAAQAARARAVAEGSDVQAMYRFGRNPITGETLSLGNAAPSMLVDPNGNVVPQDLVSTYKPTAQQRQTADTARQVLAIGADLQRQIAANPALIGPLAGRSKQGLAKLGLGDAQAQKLLDDVSLLQSAVTKMHTGRFSSEILKKTGSLITPGMNVDQFNGAVSSIQGVANRYANEDRLTTVQDYQQQQSQRQPSANASAQQVQIPAGAQIGRDAKGNVVGYKLPSGQYVPINGVSQ